MKRTQLHVTTLPLKNVNIILQKSKIIYFLCASLLLFTIFF